MYSDLTIESKSKTNCYFEFHVGGCQFGGGMFLGRFGGGTLGLNIGLDLPGSGGGTAGSNFGSTMPGGGTLGLKCGGIEFATGTFGSDIGGCDAWIGIPGN